MDEVAFHSLVTMRGPSLGLLELSVWKVQAPCVCSVSDTAVWGQHGRHSLCTCKVHPIGFTWKPQQGEKAGFRDELTCVVPLYIY